MRHVLFPIGVLSASLALANSGQTERVYEIVNSMSKDTNMSQGTPSVPCYNSEWLGVDVACSTSTTYTKISGTSGGRTEVSCGNSDAGLSWRDSYDHDNEQTIRWQCSLDSVDAPTGTTSSKQVITLSGELSLCKSFAITAQSSCTWSSATGQDGGLPTDPVQDEDEVGPHQPYRPREDLGG